MAPSNDNSLYPHMFIPRYRKMPPEAALSSWVPAPLLPAAYELRNATSTTNTTVL